MSKSELKHKNALLQNEIVILEAKLETQATLIRTLTNDVEALTERLGQSQAWSDTAWYMFRALARQAKIMIYAMMLDSVMSRTHRERNEHTRDHVRWINELLETKMDVWVVRAQQEKLNITDDIPF